MSDGRTLWRAKDTGWNRRERVVALGMEFGPAGPMVLDQLEAEAQEQRAGGKVKTGYATLARSCFLTGVEEAERIVAFAVEIGAIDDFEPDPDGRRFKGRVSGFASDQQHMRAAARQKAHRDKEIAENGSSTPKTGTVTDRYEPSGTVTECDEPSPTGQYRTEVGDESPTTPLASSCEIVKRVSYGRKPVPPARLELAERVLAEFNRQASTGYGAYTGRGQPSEDLKRIIGALTDAVPALEFDEARLMIEAALRRPYWDGRPHTGVVFGPGVIGRYREEARRAAPREEGAWSRGFVAAINSGGSAAA